MSTVPTTGEEFSKFIHHLSEAQSSAYMIGHLHKAQGTSKDIALGDGWLAIGEMLKRMNFQATKIAQGKLQ